MTSSDAFHYGLPVLRTRVPYDLRHLASLLNPVLIEQLDWSFDIPCLELALLSHSSPSRFITILRRLPSAERQALGSPETVVMKRAGSQSCLLSLPEPNTPLGRWTVHEILLITCLE